MMPLTERLSDAAARALRSAADADPELGREAPAAVARRWSRPPDAGSASVAASDAAATFDAFYAEVARPLWGYLRALSGDAATADDLLQESFLRLLTARGAPTDPPERRRYLFRIAAHLLADRGRRGRLAERHRTSAGQAPPPPSPTVAFDPDLERALAELSPRERQLLWLAHVEEASHPEIAALAGLRPGSVKVLLFRARRRLGALLRARGLAPKGDGP